MVPIFLAPLDTSSHPVLQGSPHLVSFHGVVVCWAGVVPVAGSSMSPEVVIWFVVPILIFSCKSLVFIWACSIFIFLESNNIAYCAWFRLYDIVKLMLVRFSIVSLYSIVASSRACSASTIIIWASFSWVWFAALPYPWEVDVDFLRVL